MLVPISWLKDFVDIKMDLSELMWKMTEAGLSCESYQKVKEEIILDVEVTPNRPDWLSIWGVAREIAAIGGGKIKPLKAKQIPAKKADLPIAVNADVKLVGRCVGVTISNVKIVQSPEWMQKRLRWVGLRPISNVVDITNYYMTDLGMPIHAFDYDKIKDKDLVFELAKGGEEFTSVDGISYELSKGALIIKDGGKVIDLCGIKGGESSGISSETKKYFYPHTGLFSKFNTANFSEIKTGLGSVLYL